MKTGTHAPQGRGLLPSPLRQKLGVEVVPTPSGAHSHSFDELRLGADTCRALRDDEDVKVTMTWDRTGKQLPFHRGDEPGQGPQGRGGENGMKIPDLPPLGPQFWPSDSIFF